MVPGADDRPSSFVDRVPREPSSGGHRDVYDSSPLDSRRNRTNSVGGRRWKVGAATSWANRSEEQV